MNKITQFADDTRVQEYVKNLNAYGYSVQVTRDVKDHDHRYVVLYVLPPDVPGHVIHSTDPVVMPLTPREALHKIWVDLVNRGCV